MTRSIYLISPTEEYPGYHSLEVLNTWRILNAVNFSDLSITTFAALVPRDWHVTICDERITRVDFDTAADVIGITGKVSQRNRMIELARKFRARGKLVIFGGPYVSLNPDDLRSHADIIVRGEAEEIAPRLFADIASGKWEKDYEGTKPDLSLSPIPRWDLYPRRAAVTGQVQTSRGCPFDCEFCDVIQYLGRKQRWKEPDQVARELDVLHGFGYRHIFFADDNFTVMRRRTHALLDRLVEWNAQHPPGSVTFATQVSVDLASDTALLEHCAAAGLRSVFIGIETPNRESLAETRKRQNIRVDLAAEVTKVVQAGIMVMGGMIVGFDHDDSSIFERQAAFIETLPVPGISFGVLVAPHATPLYARMQREGRIVAPGDYGQGEFLQTNFQPKLMSRDELHGGAKWLLNRIYAPDAFGRRLLAFVETFPARSVAGPPAAFGPLELALAARLGRCGRGERDLVALFESLRYKRPDLRALLTYLLVFYCQAHLLIERYSVSLPPVPQNSQRVKIA
jgi:radical SAM superfamily enzyme YgiQ (UPF0313 family)